MHCWKLWACLVRADSNTSLLYDADPNVIARHQPMVVSHDRIHSSYDTITSLPSYAMPAYLLTFNEPNYIYSYGMTDDDTNVLDPATAARLWPQLMSHFNPLGIKLIAPSAINCGGDPNCQNVPTAAGWLSAFQTVRLLQICPAEPASLCPASSAFCPRPVLSAFCPRPVLYQ